jgi:hypothetical protein
LRTNRGAAEPDPAIPYDKIIRDAVTREFRERTWRESPEWLKNFEAVQRQKAERAARQKAKLTGRVWRA